MALFQTDRGIRGGSGFRGEQQVRPGQQLKSSREEHQMQTGRRQFLAIAVLRVLPLAFGAAMIPLPALASSDPIPGVDVVVEKVPPGTMVGRLQTDQGGYLRFRSLSAGTYRVRDLHGNTARVKHPGGSALWRLVGSFKNGKPVWNRIVAK